MIWFQLAIFILTSGIFVGLYFGLKNKSDKTKLLIFKILALVYFAIFLTRLFSTDAFHYLVKFNMPQYGSNAVVVLTSLLRWTMNLAVILAVCVPFLKAKTFKDLLQVVALPIFVLNFIFFARNIHCIIGFKSSIVHHRTFLFSAELIVGLLICLYSIFIIKHKIDYKNNKKQFWKSLAISLPLLLLMVMPLDTLQQWFGKLEHITIDFMTFAQHVWILLLLVIIFAFHYGLRKKDYDTKFAVLLLISVSMFFQYFGKMNYLDTLIYHQAFDFNNLPLHICNLATALIPLSLITKNKFLFSFTYYINVVGALIAIIVPDVTTGALSYSFLVFAYEHSFAFMLPILYVSLGMMPRTQKNNFKYAMISFSCYFVFAIICNVIIFNFDSGVNYFFLNNDFLPNKIGILKTLKELWLLRFSLGKITISLYPLYYLGVYVGFSAIMFLTFFIYRWSYRFADNANLQRKNEKDDYEKYLEFVKSLNGKSVEEPAKKEGDIMIKFENFSKKYKCSDKYAVKDFNLEIKEGEVFGFLGQNGAGKSTTIKSLVGILPFEEGKIYVDGYDIEKQPLGAKKLIGYVPDNHAVYERLTGRQYVNFIADLFEVSVQQRNEIIDDLAQKFNLTEAIDKPIKTYSHGMKQKITIISALVHKPKVWVLDEPLTGLDPQSGYEVKKIMREHAENGNTVFFSSHIIEVVEKVCDRVAIIYKGQLKGVYDMKELEKNGQSLVDIFISSQKEE